MLTYKASYSYVEGGVHVEILDFPGAITCAKTLDDARRMARAVLVDMAETYLLDGKALPLPDPGVSDPEADLVEPVQLVLRGRTSGEDSRPVHSRADLCASILRLSDEFRNDGDHWENPDLPSYLDALASWLEDCDGFYRNAEKSTDPGRASWQLFGDALSAAAIYE